MTVKHQRGTGWANLWFAIAIWVFLIVGVPMAVQWVYNLVEPWLPL
jgi:hypothetical protein